MKEVKVKVPEGYEIDKDNSTFECIKFKKKSIIKNYDDLITHNIITKKGYYLDRYSLIASISNFKAGASNCSICLNYAEALSQKAMGKISQLMPYYGGAFTKEEWTNDNITKYTLRRVVNKISKDHFLTVYHYLAFRTEENRDRFLKENEQLVKDYLMLD